MSTLSVELTLIVVAILANAFFAGAEIAIISARVPRLAQLRDAAVRGAASALRLKEAPEAFLATIQVAVTVVSTLASAVGGVTAIESLTPLLARLPILGAVAWAEPAALGIVIVCIAFVSLVVGELTPKAIALRNPERLACYVAGPVERLSRAASGAVAVLTGATRLVLRALGQPARPSAPQTSAEEVRYLVRVGAAGGIFRKVEEDLVHNVFEFADKTAREIMVPRSSILGLDVDTPAAEVLARAAAIAHARIPVYRGSIDQPVGVLVMKDLLRCAAAGEPPVLAGLVHPPVFAPETALVSGLLRQFQRRQQSLAFVVDEYGSIAGLVTLEDVLEEIVGEIREEHEQVSMPYLKRLADGSFVLDGAAEIEELRDRLDLPIPVSPAYRTLAGFLIHSLRSVPGPGAGVDCEGYRFTVVDVDGPRITKVAARREAPGA
jgi:putative hemolysin